MANQQHSSLGNQPAKMHGSLWQTVANAAALAALVVLADDVTQAKVVKQTDTGSLWIPTSIGAGAAFDSVVKVAGAALANGQIPVWVAAAGAWQAQTLTPIISLPANPADNGKVAIASAGDFIYLAPGAVGNVLTSNGTAWISSTPGAVPNVSNTAAGLAPIITGTTGLALISNGVSSAWSTNFQAQNLLTTGGVALGGAVTPTSTLAAGFLSMSGHGNGGITYRNIANLGDIQVLALGNGATDDRATLGASPNASVTVNLSTGRLSLGATQALTWSATIITLPVAGYAFNFGVSGTIQKGAATILGFPNSANQTCELWANAANFQGGDRLLGWNQLVTFPAAAPASAVVFVYVNRAGSQAGLSTYGPSDTISTLGY